jgi:hypothetical protein
MWQLLTISPGNMANFAKTNPKKTYVAFVFDFLKNYHNAKFTKNKPLTMTLPNSQVPNSTFGTTKNPPLDRVHICHFTIFEPTEQKLFNLN